jgi:hypothetical protein
LIALTKKYTENRDYHLSTETERERVIQEIVEDINTFVLPFFKQFENVEGLAEQVPMGLSIILCKLIWNMLPIGGHPPYRKC